MNRRDGAKPACSTNKNHADAENTEIADWLNLRLLRASVVKCGFAAMPGAE